MKPQNSKMARLNFIATLLTTMLLLLCTHRATGENRTFSGTLDASPYYIHYSEGYLVAPGTLDLSGLMFSTSDDGSYEVMNRTPDDESYRTDDVTEGSEGNDGGGVRSRGLQRQRSNSSVVSFCGLLVPF